MIFAIDRGGTFTDVYAYNPENKKVYTTKLLSEDSANYPNAPAEGIRRILAELGQEQSSGAIPISWIESLRMGTTIATNALLERKGARVCLMITEGFKDLLRIGNQSRPDLFDLRIAKPDLLYEKVIEVAEEVRCLRPDESVNSGIPIFERGGDRFIVERTPDFDELESSMRLVYGEGIRNLAVVLKHAYGFTQHEERIEELAKKIGFRQVSISSKVMPRVKMVNRGDTTMVDAYLTEKIKDYTADFRSRFQGEFEKNQLLFMQSDGGLAQADSFMGSRAILSGPAGGVVGFGKGCKAAAENRPLIGFDMGGTSTDVSRFDGEYDLTYETETAGVRIQSPQLNIRTIAAGGGSKLVYEQGIFKVGPESVGAEPGPVCYKKGGELAITDANLLLGRIQPSHFPKIFGPTAKEPLDSNATKIAFAALTESINRDLSQPKSPEEVALGFIRVANEMMARAIRDISVMRGYDLKEHVLATFGGAGAQHAVGIARLLGMNRIVIHRLSGILSAFGMALADRVVERQAPVSLRLEGEDLPRIEKGIEELADQAILELKNQGFAFERIEVKLFLNLRFQGTDTALTIPKPHNGDWEKAFKERYFKEFGFLLEDCPVQADNLLVRAHGKTESGEVKLFENPDQPAEVMERVSCYFEEGWRDTPLYDLEQMQVNQRIQGPALVIHSLTTILIEPDSVARLTEEGHLLIELQATEKESWSTEADPIRTAIFGHLFMSIAEQMGWALQRTAISTNIKERHDFSCALFGPEGDLIANAPHQPVHLGAMSEAVKYQIRLLGEELKEGDVILSNHPQAGGSHLPDFTVITPVFHGGRPIFFVANRGHHADVGGITPGSMPPFSTCIDQEGIAVKSFHLVREGHFRENEIKELLQESRKPDHNLSDLKAQIAANQRGIQLVLEMVEHYGLAVVHAYMNHLQTTADQATREALHELFEREGSDHLQADEPMDDGSLIALSLHYDRTEGRVIFDFTETSDQVEGNLNASRAVTLSAVLYCLRVLIAKDLPLNQGCLSSIKVITRPGSMLEPNERAAVAGGNVLTSQRLVDVILKAFKSAAASQGCMNNLTFGDESFGYYETIGGGAGAGPDWEGQSGVHTHMTNTRITDPEILERNYPVILEEFSLRKDSGGKGLHQGGEGLLRRFRFLKPLSVSILSERRRFPPYGLEGGEPGALGENRLFDLEGHVHDLGGKNQSHVKQGERIEIRTPGGGGYAKPKR